MSFFKDFKADFTQAMNELMPDGNEMYDEDELIEEESVEIVEEPPKKTKKTKEKPVKEKVAKEKANEKKTTRSRKKNEEQEILVQTVADTETIWEDEPIVDEALSTDNQPLAENLDVDELLKSLESMRKSKKSKGVAKKTTQSANIEKTILSSTLNNPESDTQGLEHATEETPQGSFVETAEEIQADDMEIAPEDMLEQIDDLLDKELYGEEQDAPILPDDDMEVNTMDMSVEELLNQLAMKQSAEEQIIHVEEPEEKSNNILDELVTPMEDNVSDEDVMQELSVDDLLSQLDAVAGEFPEGEPEETMEEVAEEIEAILEEEAEEEPEETMEEVAEEIEAILEEEAEEEPEETVEEVAEEIEAILEEEAEEESEETVEEVAEEIEAILEEEVEEESEETVAEIEVALEEEVESETIEETTVDAVVGEVSEEEASLDDLLEQLEENRMENVEDNTMAQKKEVISINTAEEVKEETKAVEEKVFNVEEADAETTYITKGTKIKGDLETDGSIDIIGAVEGSVICKGKVVVGGNVVGNITAGELYANSARIEGSVKSYGSVKVGVGTMIIGGIEGESAVIAGAVNGDIDVKGPVIVDSTAVIMGNIKSRSVQINNGAVIEGFCSQSYSDIDVKSFFA